MTSEPCSAFSSPRMRNVRNIAFGAWAAPPEFDGELLTSSCWDPAKDEVLCTFGPSSKDGRIRLFRVARSGKAGASEL